jgi:uncharacterized protein YpuA (DUF1002 family)
MENILAELKAIMQDAHEASARAGEYKMDIDRGINVNHTPEYDTSVTKQDKINSLFEYLIDAKSDMDRVQESLKDIHNKLDDLLELVEYENIAKEIR